MLFFRFWFVIKFCDKVNLRDLFLSENCGVFVLIKLMKYCFNFIIKICTILYKYKTENIAYIL